MKEINDVQLEKLEGGINWACVAAGFGTVAIIADPISAFAIGDATAFAWAACLASEN